MSTAHTACVRRFVFVRYIIESSRFTLMGAICSSEIPKGQRAIHRGGTIVKVILSCILLYQPAPSNPT